MSTKYTLYLYIQFSFRQFQPKSVDQRASAVYYSQTMLENLSAKNKTISHCKLEEIK